MYFRRAALLSGLSLAACQPSLIAKASTPQALFAPAHDEDVIWVTRDVELKAEQVAGGWESRHASALFACYRAPKEKPGQPICYMAKYEWTADGLIWPGPIWFYQDGKIGWPKEPTRQGP